MKVFTSIGKHKHVDDGLCPKEEEPIPLPFTNLRLTALKANNFRAKGMTAMVKKLDDDLHQEDKLCTEKQCAWR